MQMKKIGLFLLLLFVGITSLTAQDLPSEPVGHVNDFANLLNQSDVQRLETKLRNYRDSTTNVITIATLPDLQGYSIEEAATQLFNNWQMWHEDRYNGVLILVAPSERKMRIEVGYGLEGAIPDIMAGRIIREILSPHFGEGDFYGGLDRATSVLISLAAGEFEGEQLASTSSSGDSPFNTDTIIFFLFIAFVIYITSRRGGGKGGKRRRRHSLGSSGIIWLGGGFGSGGGGSFGGGGGFSGGGGFGSGGGGASGGW